MRTDVYWFPWTLPGVNAMLIDLSIDHEQVILYGEVYGKIQKGFDYGNPKGLSFAAFDLLVDGQYMDHDAFYGLCSKYGVPTVPYLRIMAYSLKRIQELAEGQSTLGGTHVREGVVVKPLKERTDSKIGRVILKFVGDGYLLGKHGDFADR